MKFSRASKGLVLMLLMSWQTYAMHRNDDDNSCGRTMGDILRAAGEAVGAVAAIALFVAALAKPESSSQSVISRSTSLHQRAHQLYAQFRAEGRPMPMETIMQGLEQGWLR